MAVKAVKDTLKNLNHLAFLFRNTQIIFNIANIIALIPSKEVADGMICAKASGKVVLQVCLKQEPSVAWPVSFSIQTKIPERQPESEQLSKAASDQVPAKTKKTVITHQKLPKIAITSLRSKKKGQLIIRWKKKQGIGGYEVQYGA